MLKPKANDSEKLKKQGILKLKIRPGLQWTGHLTIIGREGTNYIVQFDAQDPKATSERFIYDRTVMTPEKLKEWTGLDLKPVGAKGSGGKSSQSKDGS